MVERMSFISGYISEAAMAAAVAVVESKTGHDGFPNFFEDFYEVKPKDTTVACIASAKELFKIDFPIEVKAYRPQKKINLAVPVHHNLDFKEIWIMDSEEEGLDLMTTKFFCYRAVGDCYNHMKGGHAGATDDSLFKEMLRKIFCHLIIHDLEGIAGAVFYKNIRKTLDRSDLICHEILTDVLILHGYKLKYEINILKDKLLCTILLVDRWKTSIFGHEMNHSCALPWQERINNFIQLMFDLKYNDYTISSRL